MIDQTQLDAAKSAVTSALDTFNANKAKLLTHDGKPILEPAAHARAVEKAGEPLRAAVEKALALGDAAIAEAEKGRLQRYADTTTQLNPIELDEAGRLAAFVREDCQTLSLSDLAERLRWTQSAGGKARHWLTMRYAVQRWKAEEGKTPQPAGFVELGEVMRDLGAFGPRAGLSPELQRLSENAAQLKRWARGQLLSSTGVGTGRPMGI